MENVSLAQIAYQAYGAWLQWKTADGKRIPYFDELPVSQRNAWTAAAEKLAIQVREEERSLLIPSEKL